MRPERLFTPTLIAALAFVLAAGLSWLGAVWAVTVIETRSTEAVAAALRNAGHTWVLVSADGLQLGLTGTAPTEADRFRAITVAGGLVDSARLIDNMAVAEATAIQAPLFSMELLRNGDGISVIGLIPAATERAAITAQIATVAAGASVTDMLETADYPVPPGWPQSVDFGLQALKALPRSKISISPNRVTVTAISDSTAEKTRLEAALAKLVPEGLAVQIGISAPRPVITPFTLRFLIDDGGARFDACSADTAAARDRILQAAAEAGMGGGSDCTIGLGVPSPQWGAAVATGIAGLAELGGGTLTFSDTDVSLIAGAAVTQASFDRVVGDLEAKLPDVFSLQSVMPEKTSAVAAGDGPPEFTATLSDTGQVQLRGRLPDERVRNAVDSYARARFGSEAVYTAARLDPNLPDGWPIRVLSALEALAELDHGDVRVQQDLLEVRGVTGNPAASAAISRVLSEKLGQGKDFRIIVSYDKTLDPNAGLPTARECGELINAQLARKKITFAPGSAEIDAAANPTLTGIAKVLSRCGTIPFEIGGHTDAQGGDEMNRALSQLRAEAVQQALMAQGVLVAGLTAMGYGETQPIGDNKTVDGRETNRRIEFRLLLSAAEAAKVNSATAAADTGPALQTGSPPGAGVPLPSGATLPVTLPVPGPGVADTHVTDGPARDTPASAAVPEEPVVEVLPATENQARPRPRPVRN